MFKKLDSKTAYEYHMQYTRANNSDRTAYVQDSTGNRQFFFGDQWTQAEINAMSDRGQYAAKINYIKKFITSLVGIMNADKPMLKSVPFGKEDHVISDICNTVFSHVYNKSSGTVMMNSALNGALRDNIGWIMVKQNEHNETVFEYLPVEQVIVDQDSNDPYFRDASVIYIEKMIPMSQVRAMYDIPENEHLMSDVPDTWEEYVGDTNTTLKVTRLIDDSKTYVRVIEGYHRTVVPDPQDPFRKRVRMVKKTLLGYSHVFEEDLHPTITNHCIIPLYFAETGNVFKRGLVYFLKDIQRFLNKSFGVMLLNAQLHSNPKVFVYKDSVPLQNLEDFQQDYNKPGSVIFLDGDGKESVPPTVVQGAPLSGAWYQIVEFLAGFLEFNAIDNNLTGSDINANSNQSQTQIFQQYQLMLNAYREFLNLYEGFMSALGETVLQYFFAYSAKDSRVFNGLFNVPEIQARVDKAIQHGFIEGSPEAEKAYTDYLTSVGVHPAQAVLDITVVKKEIDFLKKITAIKEDASSLNFDVSIEKGSYLASHSTLRFAMKMELYQQNLIDNETVLMDAPIENKEEAIQRVSQIKVLQSQNISLQTELEKSLKEIENLKNTVADGAMQQSLTEHNAKLDKQRNDFVQKERSNQKIEKMQSKTQLNSQLLEGESLIQKALLSLQKKAAEYDIAKKKLEAAAKKDTVNFEDIITSELNDETGR